MKTSKYAMGVLIGNASPSYECGLNSNLCGCSNGQCDNVGQNNLYLHNQGTSKERITKLSNGGHINKQLRYIKKHQEENINVKKRPHVSRRFKIRNNLISKL